MKLRPWVYLLAGFSVFPFASIGYSQEVPSPVPTAQKMAEKVADSAAPEKAVEQIKKDTIAARFLNSCAGCHSLKGVKLTGPDLSPVVTWPEVALRAAIKVMEKNVGSLSDSDVVSLARFLQSGDSRERLAAESERIKAQFAAKLEVGSPARGQALFHGREPLANAGLSCNSCHKAGGKGGSLGPNLTTAYEKMGEAPLLSGIEKASYKIMAAHYAKHPITSQEAVHLVAYLKTLKVEPEAPGLAVKLPGLIGIGLSILGFAALVAYGRRGLVRRSRKLEHRKH